MSVTGTVMYQVLYASYHGIRFGSSSVRKREWSDVLMLRFCYVCYVFGISMIHEHMQSAHMSCTAVRLVRT